jgi:hypothetical protein
MTSSNYLPPFTIEQRAAVTRGTHRSAHASVATPSETDVDATYADFLGDEVDD